MSVKECFEQGLLKKDKPDIEKARRSIEIAKHKLELARKEIDARIYENAVISVYTAMFHAARALLFKDGVKERSHWAVYLYIKEKYSEKLGIRLVNELNSLRLERHEAMYGLEKKEENMQEETEIEIGISKEFVASIEKLV